MLQDASGECYDPYPETTDQRAVREAKEHAAELLARAASGDPHAEAELPEVLAQLRKATGEEERPPLTNAAGIPTQRTGSVPVTAYRQINSYYCDPATAQTILRYLGPQTSVAYDSVYGGYPTLNGSTAHGQPILANFFWLATDNYG